MKIGTWSVMTLKKDYRTDILTEEFRRFELLLLGISETHIPGVRSIKFGDIEFAYSGRKAGVHTQGVGLMMNKEAAKSCLGWKGIDNRILIAHFMTKKFRIISYSIICPCWNDKRRN